MRRLIDDEQHAALVVPVQVTDGIEHAVALLALKSGAPAVEDTKKSRVAALIRHGWSTLMIDGRQKEHVAAFDERLVLGRDFREHYACFDIVGKTPCIEAILQR